MAQVDQQKKYTSEDFNKVLREQERVRNLPAAKRYAWRVKKTAEIMREDGLSFKEAWWYSDSAAMLWNFRVMRDAGCRDATKLHSDILSIV